MSDETTRASAPIEARPDRGSELNARETSGSRALANVAGTLAAIAARLGCVPSTVWFWRTGARTPTAPWRGRIRDVFGIDPATWDRPPGSPAPRVVDELGDEGARVAHPGSPAIVEPGASGGRPARADRSRSSTAVETSLDGVDAGRADRDGRRSDPGDRGGGRVVDDARASRRRRRDRDDRQPHAGADRQPDVSAGAGSPEYAETDLGRSDSYHCRTPGAPGVGPRCTWERCPRPEEPVTAKASRSPDAPAMHLECRRARNDAARRCQHPGCPTPDVLLHRRARKDGATMHVGCVALTRRAVRPSACECGAPLAGPTARLCAACGAARRAGGTRGGGPRVFQGPTEGARQLRATGLSTSAGGRVLGVSPMSFSKWRAGVATPSAGHREVIARLLGVPVAAWTQPPIEPEHSR